MNTSSIEIPDLFNEILPIQSLVPTDDLAMFSLLSSQYQESLSIISSHIAKYKRIGVILPTITTEFDMVHYLLESIYSELKRNGRKEDTLVVFERREIIEDDYKKRVTNCINFSN